jgi:hypothetical protein
MKAKLVERKKSRDKLIGAVYDFLKCFSTPELVVKY